MNRIDSAKDNLINACMYLISALQEQGIQDVNREVADTIATSIKLSNMQKQYIASINNIDISTTLKNIKELLFAINKKGMPLNDNDFEILSCTIDNLSKCVKEVKKR